MKKVKCAILLSLLTGGKFQYTPVCVLKRERFGCAGLWYDSVENQTNKGKIKRSFITCRYISLKGNKRHCLIVVIPG